MDRETSTCGPVSDFDGLEGLGENSCVMDKRVCGDRVVTMTIRGRGCLDLDPFGERLQANWNRNLTFWRSGFFGPDAIRPFNREVVEHELKAKKFKTKDLENAVREALNPSSIEREQQEDEDEEEEEESEEENKKSKRGKTTRRRGGTSETKRRGAASSSSNGRKPRGKAKAEDEGQDEEDEAKMRRRSRRIEDEDKDLDDTETPGRKKRVCRSNVSLTTRLTPSLLA